MKYINTNIHSIYVASALLYRYGGNNMDVQIVDYDYFHLLVTLDKEFPDVRCGVVVIDAGYEKSQSFKDYLEELSHGVIKEDSPDNMPILIIIVDQQDNGYIKILLGLNNRFEKVIYAVENIPLLNEKSFSNLEPVIKSMNQSITVLSLSSVCVLKTIPFYNINQKMEHTNGIFLYARRNTVDYQIKAIKYENQLDNYLLKPSFEKDELDKLIIESITKKYKNELELEPLNEKLIILSSDITQIQLYDKEHGYMKIPYIIRFVPEVTNIPDAVDLFGLNNRIEFPSISVSIYVRGNSNQFLGNIYDEISIPLNKWISKCSEIIKLKESFVDVDKWINVQ